jgi:hypothetical protein
MPHKVCRQCWDMQQLECDNKLTEVSCLCWCASGMSQGQASSSQHSGGVLPAGTGVVLLPGMVILGCTCTFVPALSHNSTQPAAPFTIQCHIWQLQPAHFQPQLMFTILSVSILQPCMLTAIKPTSTATTPTQHHASWLTHCHAASFNLSAPATCSAPTGRKGGTRCEEAAA